MALHERDVKGVAVLVVGEELGAVPQQQLAALNPAALAGIPQAVPAEVVNLVDVGALTQQVCRAVGVPAVARHLCSAGVPLCGRGAGAGG